MSQAAATAPPKTILVALSGLSPAVITETVWALAREVPPILPSRVVALTTVAGRDGLRTQLLHSGTWQRLRDVLRAPAGTLLFGDSGDAIRVFPAPDRATELNDIVTDRDNDAVADFILDNLRQFTEDADTRLVLSVAGGRKTMTALGALCMALLGREQDRLVHVVVNPPFDRPDLEPRFVFPDPAIRSYRLPDGQRHKPTAARIRLCDIPFVRVRNLFAHEYLRLPGAFSATVALANRRLGENLPAPRLLLRPTDKTCRLNDKPVALSPAEFVLCWLLAARRIANQPPFRGQEVLMQAFAEFANNVAAEQMPEIVHHRGPDGAFPGKNDKDDFRKLVSSLRAKFRHAAGNAAAEACLPAGPRGVYALALPPDRVTIKLD
ncbi:MAG: CRISPR-associated protein [Lentisphaerae bacterium RIFOXYB12_FULL_65_16]|nr:MAG: CRISPR-associated protein [Lentisphaerae bacterium RIFOXYA12_64_32]OGV88657.1 MAG: CRISPR-associated protein [Lentisphaerae bacterium RIFOXYB12_FULL_65_16]